MDDTSDTARSAAMGSALVGGTDGVSALIDNPAGLAYLKQGQVLTNSHLWLVDSFQETLLLGLPGPEGWGGFGLAGSYLNYGTFEGRDVMGSLTSPYSADSIAFKASWGREILKDLSLGLGFQGVQTTLASTSSWAFATDFGLLFRPWERVRMGASCDNLGLGAPSGTAGAAFHLGASLDLPLDPQNQLLVAFSGTTDPATFDRLQAGVEYGFQQLLFLRAGYQQPLSDNGIGGWSGLTAGVGICFSGFRLDYAYFPYGELGTSNRVSLGYQFGESSPANQASVQGRGKDLTAPSPSAGMAHPGSSSPSNTDQDFSRNAVAAPGLSPHRIQSSGQNTVPTLDATASSPKGPVSSSRGAGTANPSSTDQSGTLLPRSLGENAEKPKDQLSVEFDFPSDSTLEGKALEKQGKYQDALRSYLDAVKKDPEDVSAWTALGNLYYRFNQKAYAIFCYEQVTKLEPENKDVADWLQKYKAAQP